MRGHHIYTSSWFKYGSNIRNPGTYTVELTGGLFGSNTEEIVFNLNQMCASVPESLAPRNTDQSLLRIYHILPDSTVVSRSWFVTDEITGRGTVPYTYSLIFRGNDNEDFLYNPAGACDIKSAEPYQSFRRRAGVDGPTESSRYYDHSKEYNSPFPFDQNKWKTVFGLDDELFLKYYISLGRAICFRGNARIAVILRKDWDGEKFILATLSLLPLFMKRKFAAASRWTGMMDGSGSTAVNGIHLLCYYDESPVSESGFPVIDFTGAGRHANIAAPSFSTTESMFARWIWENIDKHGRLISYESFLESWFSGVLDKMPFIVVANIFYLWQNRDIDNYDLAKECLLLVAESFPRNFGKYAFISSTLKTIINRLRERIETSDFENEIVQAACLLAKNGSTDARKLVQELFGVFKQKKCWGKLAIVLKYYRSVILGSDAENVGEEGENALRKLGLCLDNKDKECAKIALESLIDRCQNLRKAVLQSDRVMAEGCLSEYKLLSSNIKNIKGVSAFPDTFFQINDITEINATVAEHFYNLEKFHVEELSYTPTIEHWLRTVNRVINIEVEHRRELWRLYYRRIPDRKKCLDKLERQNQVLAELAESSADVNREVAEYYKNNFISKWKTAAFPLDSDQTWEYLKKWHERLSKVKPVEKEVLEYIRRQIALNEENIVSLAEGLSTEYIQMAAELYRDVGPLNKILEDIKKVDQSAAEKDEYLYFDGLGEKAYPNPPLPIIRRMHYWHNKTANAPVKWSFAVAEGDSGSIDLDLYLALRRSKKNAGAEETGVLELLHQFADIVAGHYKNRFDFDTDKLIRNSITRSKEIKQKISNRYFEKTDVLAEFKNLRDLPIKEVIGTTIYNLLGNRVDEKIRDVYWPQKIKSFDDVADPVILVILGIFIVVISLMGLLSLEGENVIPHLCSSTVLMISPYVLAALIIVVSFISAVSLLKEGGKRY